MFEEEGCFKELCPVLGHRLKIKSKLKGWKNNRNTATVSTVSVCDTLADLTSDSESTGVILLTGNNQNESLNIM